MAVSNAMFLFEVVVESVKSLVESRNLVIRSEFADVFSLELKDPKQLHIVMPEPPPLPPEPPGKKGKAKKPPAKAGKKGAIELPPPEPIIQSGQSVLFTSSAEFLIQTMKKFPMEVSLWSKEDNFVFIGSTFIPWDPKFLSFLEKICDIQVTAPVTLNEEYNIFEEGTAKPMAKLGIQIKLSYLTDKVTTSFRTLSEDPAIKKYLYTGINSKTTSYICTMKTTDEDFVENSNKIENTYLVDKPKPKGMVFADYKNAPGANLTFFNEGDYCCMGNADKPPESIYKALETAPDIDHIIEYIRKIVVSCNDNMRMLTPRPAIKPRLKATDIDRFCYCKETSWPKGKLAERFRNEVQSGPCPICTGDRNQSGGSRGATFDIANIRGPCGKPDCRIAREMRAYIKNLVEEDNTEFNISEIVGPCGSKTCTLAEKIQEFIRHEGVFDQGSNLEGLSTQCACLKQMQDALENKKSCDSLCEKKCDESSSDSFCGGKTCPFGKSNKNNIYNVFYFTVEHDFEKESDGSSTPVTDSSKYKYCSTECPSMKTSEKTSCSKITCSTSLTDKPESLNPKCPMPICPEKNATCPPSPADSNIVIDFTDIHNPCCVKSCDIAEKVKYFIVDGVRSKKRKSMDDGEDQCYCDCVCSFKFSSKTKYCAVCGGYECLGYDMKDQPEYAKPHPCPVYHKLYDKNKIKAPNPWPEEEQKQKKAPDAASTKSARTVGSRSGHSDRRLNSSRSVRGLPERREKKVVQKIKKVKQEKKKVGKFTANVQKESHVLTEKKLELKYPYPAVPKHMGWNWTAEDIPGMKPRPKWKPGAANKILVRRYRTIREGVDTIAKKKRAMLQRKKKVETKPTLVVKKQDGEYTVQMEVFKKYSKERLLFQYPYDEQPPLIYTIGKTPEEKYKIQKLRERRERRETRRKCRLLQSSFKDKCQEICLKAYNQAIGLLPISNPNEPECPCSAQPTENLSPQIDSCSCSEEGSFSSSDTDGDEWIIEFSPPASKWDSKAKHPPVLTDNESQYNYLDFKVKLSDKYGNPVPRFFKGPDGKQECSDLGGFWGPNHVWLEINKDGYIGVDNRWVPMSFTGHDGMIYTADEGSFTDSDGHLLKIGIDGYIDKEGKWAWYSKRGKARSDKSKSICTASVIIKKEIKPAKSEPQVKSAQDVKSKTNPAKGDEKKNITPAPGKRKDDKVNKTVPQVSAKGKTPLVMSFSVEYDRSNLRKFIGDRKNNMDMKKMAKYKEIMQDLKLYDDLCELKVTAKTNRASNTPRKKISPFTIFEGSNMQHTNTFGSSINRSPMSSSRSGVNKLL